jgi:glycosyltransferase involved in cell wall biosynthesis
MNKAVLTFILPGNSWSGGVRVTALMGNQLLDCGYDVRIVYPYDRLFSLSKLAGLRCYVKRFLTGQHSGGWLHTFSGKLERYGNINELNFREGEIVIAVGSLTLRDLQNLRAPNIIKVRYNHGLPLPMTEDFRALMSLPTPTITVSNKLVPELERLSGEKVQGVIPNGIDTSQYYPAPNIKRDAIGTIFSSHPTKAPHVIIELCNRVRNVFRNVQVVVFSTERRPSGLSDRFYVQCPSIDRARELYSRSLIWLVASDAEGFGIPILEAMACGTVVISTDTYGGLELIKDGINGLIVPKGDVDGFIRKISTVLSDTALREKLICGGFDTVKQFSWTAAADRMEEFLESVQRSQTQSGSRVGQFAL